ncbi:MAG: flagellar basal body-associated FliL family protein [Pseudomonadota bacterium]
MADIKDANDTPKAGAGQAGLIGPIVLGLGTAASAFALVFFFTPSSEPAALAACEPAIAVIQPAPPPAAEDAAFVPLKEFIITIGSSPAERYLKMNISVATRKDFARRVETAEPMLIDSFNGYLRTSEVSDFEDPAYYAQMRDQLARRAELVLGDSVSDGILITEFLLR